MYYDILGNEITAYDIMENPLKHNIKYKSISGTYGLVGRWYKKIINDTEKDFTNTNGAEIYTLVSDASYVLVSLKMIGAYADNFDKKHIAYSIDGEAPIRVPYTDGRIEIPDRNQHTLRIITDSSYQNGNTTSKWLGTYGWYIDSIVSDGTLNGIYPINKIGIFYGDSITEGINALGTNSLGEACSATSAFPYYCAESLGCIPYRCGYGGSGFTTNGSFKNFADAVKYVEDGIEVSEFNPSFIFIYHGTNDHTTLTHSVIAPAFDAISEKYGNVPVFVGVPYTWQSHRTALKYECDVRSNFHLIETSGLVLDKTDSAHLSAVGAKTFGRYVADEIIKVLGSYFFTT